jgi:hypothetical protein
MDKILWDSCIFDSNVIQFCPCCFTPQVGKVGSKNLVSIFYVAYGDWAISQKFFPHHASKLPFGGISNHSLNTLGFSGPLDIMPGVSFEVLPHSVNKHQLYIAARV